MSSIGKYQLAPIKGTDLFPDTIQAPPIVRASVQYQTENNEPIAPELIEDYARNIMTQNVGLMSHFVLSQRQNFRAGVAEVTQTQKYYPEFNLSYSNIQGKHEIIRVDMRMNIRRRPLEDEIRRKDPDEVVLLILYETDKIATIPMAQLSSLGRSTASRRRLRRPRWSNFPHVVNQLRFTDQYSVVSSEIGLTGEQISETMGSLFVVHDDASLTLRHDGSAGQAHKVMNGSGNTIYAGTQIFSYSTRYGFRFEGSNGSEYPDALDAGGKPYINEPDEQAGSGSGTGRQYSCSIGSWSVNHNAVSISVVDGKRTESSVPINTEGTFYTLTFSYTQSSELCGDVYATPVTNATTAGGIIYEISAQFDGIPLGAYTWTSESTTDTENWYILATIYYYGPITVSVEGSVVGQSTGGELTVQVGSKGGAPAVSDPVMYEPLDCASAVSVFDICAGGQGFGNPGSLEAAEECAQQVIANASTYFCGRCELGYSQEIQGSGSITNTFTTWTPHGAIGRGGIYNFPYAVRGVKFVWIQYGNELSRTIYTPYGNFTLGPRDQFEGAWNIANGQHLMQAFTITREGGGDEFYVYLDGRRVDSILTSLLKTSPNSLNAAFMDIHLSKVREFT